MGTFKNYIDRKSGGANSTYYTPWQLASIYGFPPGVDGTGQKIAFIELGGGFVQSDLNNYWRAYGQFPRGNYPTVQFVSVDSAHNSPSNANSDDAEVMLDLCVGIGVAQGITPIVYKAPNSEQGFIDAVVRATNDSVNCISISWGAPESRWTTNGRNNMNTALLNAANAGITVTAASGDSGSGDGIPGSNADFPASSPYVTACGGTTLVYANNKIVSETVWNDSYGATGGGVSSYFNTPSYQSGLSLAKRGTPDVAADADPATGVVVIIDGGYYIIGGTSAAAPFWAGATAVMNKYLKRNLGFLNPLIYPTLHAAAGPFRDITSGRNGAYVARTGWDSCSGLGSPNITKLLAFLK